MEALVGWFAGKSVAVLYTFIFVAALVEGLIPIMPGDVAAALLAFLVAREGGSLPATIALVTSGSILGAVAMWWLGRRFGAEWLVGFFHRLRLKKVEHQTEVAEHRVEDAYRRYGWIALFVSRFVPGVRAVVPAVAGAMRIPLWEIVAIFLVASTLWYGAISWIAFRVGRDWETVRAAMSTFARDVGLGAVVVALLLAMVGWRLWKQRRGPRP